MSRIAGSVRFSSRPTLRWMQPAPVISHQCRTGRSEPVPVALPEALTTTEPLGDPSRGRSATSSRRRAITAAVLLAMLWPIFQTLAYGSFDALLSVGPKGPSSAAVRADIGDLTYTDEIGHDGQQFYVISRHPFDPSAAGDAVEPLAYRYRRILFPAVASVLAPGGGRAVIAVFLAESLLGVLLGAWALSTLPGAPRWLPITMAATPGVAAALGLSLCDALGAGLALAAVAMAIRWKWGPMLGFLVLAALTRETLLIVAVGLAFAPTMPRSVRALTLAAPAAALAAWAWWVSHAAGASSSAGGAQQLALPLVGWASPYVTLSSRLIGVATFALLATAAWRGRRRVPSISVALALGAALMCCYSDLVAFGWVNSSRPVAPLVPLASWVLFGQPARSREPSGPVADHQSVVPAAS